MSPRSRGFGWRLAALIAVLGLIFVLSVGDGSLRNSPPPAAGMMQTRELEAAASGTPVATPAKSGDQLDIAAPAANEGEVDPVDPLDSDPLDGDPLDGKPADKDTGAPTDQAQLEIVRSGRPSDEPATVSAYDGDPATTWIPETHASETWLWLDLGAERRLRDVRWLAQGSGAIEVSLSSDRQRWRDVGRVDVGMGWQGIDVRDDARYVRLMLLPDDDGELPAIAEAVVYGSDQEGNVSAEQEADTNRDRRRDRRERRNTESAAEQEVDEPVADDNGGGGDNGSRGRVRISAEPGETRCSGNRERCEARQGEVSVEEDCGQEGSCTIDIRADGGTAICDASGGDRTEAGDGEGKRGGRGGRCEAVANGGTVTVGDIDP